MIENRQLPLGEGPTNAFALTATRDDKTGLWTIHTATLGAYTNQWTRDLYGDLSGSEAEQTSIEACCSAWARR